MFRCASLFLGFAAFVLASAYVPDEGEFDQRAPRELNHPREQHMVPMTEPVQAHEVEVAENCCKTSRMVYIKKDQKIYDIRVGGSRTLFIQFKLKIHAKSSSSQWGNIMQVGEGYTRQPGIWTKPGEEKFVVCFNSHEGDYEKQECYTGEFEIDEEFQLSILRTGDNVEIYRDGERAAILILDDGSRPEGSGYQGVHVGNAGNPAKAMLTDLTVCEDFDEDLLTPAKKQRECEEWGNSAGAVLTKGNKIFDAPLTRDYDVHFEFKINAKNGAWCNIVHVGSTSQESYPQVYLVANQYKLLFRYNSCTNCWRQEDLYVEIAQNIWYELRFEVRELTAEIYLNDVLKGTMHFDGTDRTLTDSTPVYASSPWLTAAPGVVKNFKLCTYDH